MVRSSELTDYFFQQQKTPYNLIYLIYAQEKIASFLVIAEDSASGTTFTGIVYAKLSANNFFRNFPLQVLTSTHNQ